jgi:nucleoside-diphosphate-sugar epimerase
MAKWLITGGAGFIGSHIIEALLKEGEKVRILDNFFSSSPQNIVPFKGKIELVKGDIRDARAAKKAAAGVDYVLHQAAMRSVPRSVQEPKACVEINVDGTLSMLLAAKAARAKRFVLASSSSIYGDAAVYPQREIHLPSPISPYASSKAAGEHLCHVFTKTYGLSCVSLRYFNVFGPRQDPKSEYAAVIPRFIVSALKGWPLTIHWDGKQSRDFTYVGNVAQANIAAARAKNLKKEIYNVACGTSTSLLDIVRLLEKFTGKPLKLKLLPKRAGDIRKTFADISGLEKDLKMTRQVDFEDGLRRTYDFFQANKKWQSF